MIDEDFADREIMNSKGSKFLFSEEGMRRKSNIGAKREDRKMTEKANENESLLNQK